MELWRISNHITLNGEGGRRTGARWHSGGVPIVYLAASPPGAMIETLAHLELDEGTLPVTYTILRIEAPDKLNVETVEAPAGELSKSDFGVTRALGDIWLASASSALARVPSAIMPRTFNFLLNPQHSDAHRIRIADTERARYDARLFSFPRP